VQQEGEKISCSKEEGTAEVQQRGGGSRCSKEEGTAGAAKRRGQQVQQRGGNSRCSKEEGTAGAGRSGPKTNRVNNMSAAQSGAAAQQQTRSRHTWVLGVSCEGGREYD